MPIIFDVTPGEGTQFQWKAGGAAFVALGKVEEIDGIESSVASIKKTHLGSTLHEKRPSRIGDPGKVSGKILFNPSDPNLAIIYSRLTSPGPIDSFKVTFNDGDTTPANATFDGFFTKWKVTDIKVESNILADFEIELTDFPVYTAGTP